MSLLDQIEQRTFDAVGLHYDPAWRAAQQRLERRILSANSIILFGGHLDLLLDALRFFRLRDALAEALRRGTSWWRCRPARWCCASGSSSTTTSPPSAATSSSTTAASRWSATSSCSPTAPSGSRPTTPTTSSYLARRFRHHACVGLNQRSFLLFELRPHQAASVGADDSVIVFDPSGRKLSYHRGEIIRM